MDTQQLKAFISVADTGSFSLAAEHLHVTQPAISKRISLLEESLNTRLFDRVGRQTLLTQAGITLLPHARRILADITHATQSVSDLSGAIGGTLSIATSHHIGIHYLSPYLRDYSTLYPDVKLDLHFLDSEIAYREIIAGRFDLALLTLPREQDTHLITQQLWQDELTFVASPNHPLTRWEVLSLHDLSKYGAIVPDTSTYTTSLIKQLFDSQDAALNIDMVTNHLDAIKMLLGVGLGWGVLPERLIDNTLIKLPLSIAPIYRPLGYVRHKQRNLTRATHAFLDLLEKQSTNQ